MSGMNPAAIYQGRIAGVATIDSVYGTEHVGGTGFVANAQGSILTASHVVHEYSDNTAPTAIYVEFQSHDRVQAELVAIDHINDIAVLKVDPTSLSLHPVPLGDSDQLTPGQPIVAIGAPFGNEGSISAGIVSATHRMVASQINDRSDIADAVQFDASINPGNSGGPVFDARGRVVGIAQQIKTKSGSSAGVAFAIPINAARKVMNDLVTVGHIQYAWLGLTTNAASPQFARRYGYPSGGAIVQDVSGPAATAGLSFGRQQVSYLGETRMLGDLIVTMAGQPVAGPEDIARIVARLPVGKPTEVVYYRGSEKRTATITPIEQT